MGMGLDAVEALIEFAPKDQEQREVIKAFVNWARSQNIRDGLMLGSLATTLGLAIGALAENEASAETGLFQASKQIRDCARYAQDVKKLIKSG